MPTSCCRCCRGHDRGTAGTHLGARRPRRPLRRPSWSGARSGGRRHQDPKVTAHARHAEARRGCSQSPERRAWPVSAAGRSGRTMISCSHQGRHGAGLPNVRRVIRAILKRPASTGDGPLGSCGTASSRCCRTPASALEEIARLVGHSSTGDRECLPQATPPRAARWGRGDGHDLPH